MTQHHFPGWLIAIEGIDGAGKTTQAHHVQCALQKRHLPVHRTKEPTTGKWGQVLRDSALTGRLSLEEEIDHFIKDRREHVDNEIIPWLKAGHIILIDRYYFSNMAYQGARGHDPEDIRIKNEEFAPEPDLLVILDIEPEIGLQRIKTRGDRANHFETTGTLTKAREIYKAISKSYKYELDAKESPEELTNAIVREFSIRYVNRVAASAGTAKEKLNATLGVFGGDPI